MKSTTITIRTDPQLLDRLRDAAKREAAQIRGCTERGIDAMIRRGELRRLPGPGQVRLSYNEVSGKTR